MNNLFNVYLHNLANPILSRVVILILPKGPNSTQIIGSILTALGQTASHIPLWIFHQPMGLISLSCCIWSAGIDGYTIQFNDTCY